MRRRPPTTSHNYERKAAKFLRKKKLPPHLHLLNIGHDDWCDAINGRGYCNCRPELELREAPRPEHN